MSITQQKVNKTAQHLIFEYVTDESIYSNVAPDIKAKKITVVTTDHQQVMRFVYTLVNVEDMYFKGRKLPAMPGIGEYISEWIQPGKQITSVPNGQQAILHEYTGKKSIFSGKFFGSSGKIGLPFIRLVGEDPVPWRVLFGDPSITFIKKGDNDLMAAAYYNRISNKFEVLRDFDKTTMLERFMSRFSLKNSS